MAAIDTFKDWFVKTPTSQMTSENFRKSVTFRHRAEEFTGSLGFIVYFLIICLVLSSLAGEKVTRYFLYLVLAGMLVSNTDKIKNLLGRY